MLIIDNEEVKLNNPNPKGSEKVIIDKIKAIKEEFKGRFPLKFTYESRLMTESIMVDNAFRNPQKIPVFPKRPIKTTIDLVIDERRVRMVYTTPRDWRYNSKRKIYENRLKRIKDKDGYFVVNKQDADLAFFLMYCHPHFNDDFNCTEIEKIRKSGGDVFYKFVDNERTASKLVLKEAAKSRVQNLIYNEIKGEYIKKLAINYKVDNFEMLQPNELKVTLLSKVISKAENAESYQNVYAEFESDYKKIKNFEEKNVPPAKKEEQKEEKGDLDNLDGDDKGTGIDTNLDEKDPNLEVQMRLLVAEAIKENAVKEIGKSSLTASKKYWVYVREDGRQGTKIVNIVHDDSKDDLVNYIIEDVEVRKSIKALVDNRKLNKK